MNENVTLVTCFHDIGRDKWDTYYTRTPNDYMTSFQVFLNYDYEMIIFVDYAYYEALNIKVLDSKFPNNKKVIPISNTWLTDNIWAYSKLEREKEIMNSPEYKELVKERIQNNYPENTNAEYTILTHSKIDFVNYVSDIGLSTNDYLAWVDFGYFFNKNTPEYLPNSTLDVSKLSENKIDLCLVNDIVNSDKDIMLTLKNAPEKIGAYFFGGNRQSLRRFQMLCHKWLETFQEMNIADDEQGLWIQCYFENPDLFQRHVFGKWHQALKEFSK